MLNQPPLNTQILASDGPRGLYRGLGAVVLGAGPASAVYFAAAETARAKPQARSRGALTGLTSAWAKRGLARAATVLDMAELARECSSAI